VFLVSALSIIPNTIIVLYRKYVHFFLQKLAIIGCILAFAVTMAMTTLKEEPGRHDDNNSNIVGYYNQKIHKKSHDEMKRWRMLRHRCESQFYNADNNVSDKECKEWFDSNRRRRKPKNLRSGSLTFGLPTYFAVYCINTLFCLYFNL
jgi:hypothetical protein